MCDLLKLQKCINLVFVLQNVNAFSLAHLCILLRYCWNCFSMLGICRDMYIIRKSSAYSDHLTHGHRDFTMDLIFTQNTATEGMLDFTVLIMYILYGGWNLRSSSNVCMNFLLVSLHVGISRYQIFMSYCTPIASH